MTEHRYQWSKSKADGDVAFDYLGYASITTWFYNTNKSWVKKLAEGSVYLIRGSLQADGNIKWTDTVAKLTPEMMSASSTAEFLKLLFQN